MLLQPALVSRLANCPVLFGLLPAFVKVKKKKKPKVVEVTAWEENQSLTTTVCSVVNVRKMLSIPYIYGSKMD